MKKLLQGKRILISNLEIDLDSVKFCRTIANMDVKLDFVPPSLINFVSRQLISNGFRLYQKVVDSFQAFNKDSLCFCFLFYDI